MYQRVLITGAAGFIGSHLLRHQVSIGRSVRALDVTPGKLKHSGGREAEFLSGDISDPAIQEKAVRGIDLVFHLASAHLAVNVPDETYWRVNVHCLRGFLERCRAAGVKRFVHVSSVGVHGNIDNPPANEDSPCRPELLYERTKYEGELQVKRFFVETGFPIVIVRPVWVYGPGCPRTEKLFRALTKGRFFLVDGGRALRHCIYISDMVEALNLCGEHQNVSGHLFIIGDGRAVPIRELIDQMAATARVAAPKLSLPLWVVKPICTMVERAFTFLDREPPISERSIKFFTSNTSFDVSRATKQLGFQSKMTLQDGLSITYKSLTNSQAHG